MKRSLLFLMVVSYGFLTQGQTVIFQEDFQSEEPLEFQFFPDDAEEEDWVNFDQDLEPIATGTMLDPLNEEQQYQAFFFSLEFVAGELEDPENIVMASNSWMQDPSVASDNWLITPVIEVSNDQHVLSWRSAPNQAPRYCDGYRVLISPSGDALPGDFTDLVFQAGQMTELSEDGYGFDPEDYSWSLPFGPGTDGVSGYRPGNNFEVGNPFLVEDLDAPGDMYAILPEPFEVDLSAYDGMNIRVAFHHNSLDDYLISIDDITVTDNSTLSLEDFDFEDALQVFPNPFSEVLSIEFSDRIEDEALVRIMDSRGALVWQQEFLRNDLDARQDLDLSDLAEGLYSIQVIMDNSAVSSRNFIKQ